MGAVITFALVHQHWPFALPPLWNDETHFLIPAVSFATNGSFDAHEMLDQKGIFWVQSGFYIVYGSIFFLLGSASIPIARAASFALVAAAAVALRDVLTVTLGSLDRQRPALGHALVLGWYVTLPVVFAADMARPRSEEHTSELRHIQKSRMPSSA